MPNENRRRLNDEILQIAVTRLSPQPQWAVIVTMDGNITATYSIYSPDDILHIEEERKSAMSAAALSLGERVSSEMGHRTLRECIIYGTEGVFILVGINDDLVLSTNFAAIPSLDDTLSQLQDTVEGINKLLQAMG
jgi:predicted regulator of Ras-like GTPase activity (Roadblock/LC7/MglB family)